MKGWNQVLVALLAVFLWTACGQKRVPTLSLDGEWRFRFDPKDVGETEGWFRHDVSEEGWQVVHVPGTYNVQFPDSLWYQGKGWYRRTFSVSGRFPSGGRVLLHLNGATLRCRVWLNGQPVGEHRFAYTAATFDVTDRLRRDGDNTLAIQVDNEILERAIPDRRWNGWWNYGGLTRSVWLEWVPEAYVDRLWAETRMAHSGWNLDVVAELRNEGPPVAARLYARLLDRSGHLLWEDSLLFQMPRGSSRKVLSTNLSRVEPWSPETPNLYRLTMQLATDRGPSHERQIRVGFRDFRASGSRFLLNGRPIHIRGISRHEDFPGYGSAVPPEQTRRDLEEIKDLGCNFVRLAHYPQAPLVYDLCDELGLLVWSEIPAWKTSPEVLGDSLVFETWAKPQLEEMIQQHRHHPCVVIWSVGNEFPSETPEVEWYVRNAAAFVRSLDSTRLVTFASDRHRRRKDRCFPYVDVVAINEYYGWYYGTIHDVGGVLDSLHALFPDKPILVSEFGAGAVLGKRNPNPPDAGKDYSEDYQIKFLRTHLDQIFDPIRESYVAGGLIWVYADFADPHRIGKGHPEEYNYVNLKGLVTRDRKHKRSFDVVRRYYRSLAGSEEASFRP